MKELIKIETRAGVQTVNARDLWEGLESSRQFSDWIKDRISIFAPEVDFTVHKFVNGKATQIDYYLTIDTAKHIAMLERNEKGQAIRQYFIEVEKLAKQQPQGSELLALAVLEAQRMLSAKDAKIAELEPKAAFFDQVADSKTALQMRDAAATLNIPGLGRNNLFQKLRALGILDDKNIPYRQYQDNGYFRVVETQWTDKHGEPQISLKTLVYQKGLEYIRRQLHKAGVA